MLPPWVGGPWVRRAVLPLSVLLLVLWCSGPWLRGFRHCAVQTGVVETAQLVLHWGTHPAARRVQLPASPGRAISCLTPCTGCCLPPTGMVGVLCAHLQRPSTTGLVPPSCALCLLFVCLVCGCDIGYAHASPEVNDQPFAAAPRLPWPALYLAFPSPVEQSSFQALVCLITRHMLFPRPLSNILETIRPS